MLETLHKLVRSIVGTSPFGFLSLACVNADRIQTSLLCAELPFLSDWTYVIMGLRNFFLRAEVSADLVTRNELLRSAAEVDSRAIPIK